MATNAQQHIDDEELDDLEPIEGVEFLTRAEWMEMLDQETRCRLGLSVADFIAKYRAGEFSPDDDQHVAISFLAMLIPTDE